MFKEERIKVKTFAEGLKTEDDLEYFDGILAYLVDTLEEYLKTYYTPIEEEYEEGHEEYIRGE